MLFPDSPEDPCSSGWESPQPGRRGQRGSAAFLQTDGHWTLCPQAFLGQRRRSHTEPQNYRLHPNASLQQTNIHLRDAARRHVTGARAAITGYTQTSQTAHKNSHASRILTAPQTAVNIWQLKHPPAEIHQKCSTTGF